MLSAYAFDNCEYFRQKMCYIAGFHDMIIIDMHDEQMKWEVPYELDFDWDAGSR